MIPQKTTSADLALGASNLAKFLPDFDDLPREFQREQNPWCRIVDSWFCSGVNVKSWVAKQGIDKSEAIAHCKAIMASFEPSHEHKIAGVAFLLSQWFEPLNEPAQENHRTSGR